MSPTEDFVMPSLGAGMTEGRLLAWRVAPGDRVRRGDVIAEIDTDKSAIEVEVWHTGRVHELLVAPGTTVPVGTAMARIEVDAAVAETAVTAAPPPAAVSSVGVPEARVDRLRASPAARRLARELGVALEGLRGSGPSGAVRLEDVERAAAPRAAPSASPPDAAARMRRAIGLAMSRAKREIPHYYVGTTVGLGPATAWLASANATRPPAERMLLGVLLLKATARALREHPHLNGFWRDDHFVAGDGVHVGVAISLRGGGVVVPALTDVDRAPLADLSRRLGDLVLRARSGRLRGAELSVATATVTSLGDRGVDEVYGVIHPPQVALFGFGRPVERPWIVDGVVCPRTVVRATLSADHRASDGHAGALVLARIDALLQRPESLEEAP